MFHAAHHIDLDLPFVLPYIWFLNLFIHLKTYMQYQISPVTLYDSDECMFFTKIGNKNTIFYTVWGKTEDESRLQAEKLVELLNLNVKEQPI